MPILLPTLIFPALHYFCVFSVSLSHVWCRHSIFGVLFLLSVIFLLTLCILLMRSFFVPLILLCIHALSMLLILSLSMNFSLSHFSLAYLYLLLVSVFNDLYSFPFLGNVCCHFLVIFRISSVIYSFFSCLLTFGMVSFADITNASLNTFHFEFVFSFKLYLFLTLSTYNFATWIIQESVVLQFRYYCGLL